MEFHIFLATVVVITASGALAPGPLFFSTLIHGTKGGARAGLLASVGHMSIEMPLVFLLALGYLTALSNPSLQLYLGLAGGSAMLLFGLIQLKGALWWSNNGSARVLGGPLLTGAMMTGLNPFFIVWWLTIGGKLVFEALLLGALLGVLVMYAAHVWMDYAFLTLSAALARKGRSLAKTKGYRVMLLGLSLALMGFGLHFLSISLLML